MNWQISLLFLTIFATNTFTGCHSIDPEKVALIEYLVNNVFIPLNNVPGMSLSIVENGVTTFSKGYGKLDVERGINAADDTLFSIGSISKSFVATLVVKMLSEKYPSYGEGALDIPIAYLKPDFNFTFSDRFRAEHTSFRDLLSHRTCLTGTDMELIFGGVKTDQEYTYRTRYQLEGGCGVRGGWVYNNGLYAFVGQLVASFEGVSLERLVKNFFIEIGMNNSTTVDASASYEDLPNMSQGYYRRDGQTHKVNIRLLRRLAIGLGAGGILSTSSDMAKYMSFHLNKGKVGDRQVVSAEALSWMYKPSVLMGEIPGKQTDSDKISGTYAYGLGLMLSLYDGYATVSHGGYWPPYMSEMFLFPSKNIGIFLTTNGPGVIISAVDQNFLTTSIFDILIGSKLSPVNLESASTFPQFDVENAILNSKQRIRSIRSAKVEFADVIGYYGNALAGGLTVSLDPEDNRYLEATLGDHSIGRLLPVSGSETKFIIGWKTDILHHFYTYPPGMLPEPIFHLDFSDEKSLLLLWNDDIAAVFTRNATVDTFPVFPWDPSSCGATLA